MDLEAFMRNRGLAEDIILQFQNENIDAPTVRGMDESQLREYIPKYGDRVAIINFCKQKNSRKQSLLEKLRCKLESNEKRGASGSLKTSSDEEREKSKREKTSKKSTRCIELGWLCSMNGNKYVQVRSKLGGGTRKVQAPKTARPMDIIEMAKGFFFPNNVSSKGPINMFSVDLLDFQCQKIEANITVEELFEITAVSKLRFYLATKEIIATATSAERKTEEVTIQPKPECDILFSDINVTESNLVSVPVQFQHNSFQSLLDDPLMFEIDPPENAPFEYPTSTDMLGEGVTIISEHLEKNNVPIKLTLHRGQVFDELINAFMTLEKNCSLLHIQMLLPTGQPEAAYDTGGVFKDALSEFWQSFYEKCTVGTLCKVPYIRHDFNAEKWTAVAKILYKGYKDQKYFPIKLAPSFMEQCIFGQTLITNLNCSFFKYLDAGASETLKTAVSNFTEVDHDDLLEILEMLECKWKPTEDNIAQIIHDVGHKELIQKPMFVIDCWTNILKTMMDKSVFEDLYKIHQPTSKNVIALLQFQEPLASDDIRVIGFLKRFLREADDKSLTSFLRFCSGADIIVGQDINITFNKTSGFTRTPIAHTCGNILELPNTYDNYPDFRLEVNSVLNSNVWVMDIV